MSATTKKHVLILTLFSAFLFLLGNWGIAITDPVESNYTQTATEMLASGDFVSPRIYGNYWWDKPVMFYWELIAAYSIFGNNGEFASRFFPAVFGVIGVLMTYFFARKIYDAKTGLIAGGILATCFEYWLLCKTVITDATLFVFFNAVLVFFYVGYSSKNRKWYYLSFIFAGLATLTKGPIGILLPGFVMVVYLICRKDLKELLKINWLVGMALFLIVGGSWYYIMYTLHGDEFLNGFLGVHNFLRATQSEHPRWDVWYYYTMIFFLGFLPWCFTLPAYIWKKIKLREKPVLDQTSLFLLVWALCINFFYQCMATKYTTYTMPGLLPISIMAARYLYNRESFLRKMFLGCGAAYVLLTFFVAIPVCSHEGYSAKNVAAVYKDLVKDDDLVVTYGDYKTSLVYYGKKMVYKLDTAQGIESSRPGGLSWNAKNVMPYWDIAKLPRDKNIYLVLEEHRFDDFKRAFNDDEWQILKEFKDAKVYFRPAK